jgi:hypothetical protein
MMARAPEVGRNAEHVRLTTPAADITGNTAGVAGFADLGSGTLYGTREVSASDNGIVVEMGSDECGRRGPERRNRDVSACVGPRLYGRGPRRRRSWALFPKMRLFWLEIASLPARVVGAKSSRQLSWNIGSTARLNPGRLVETQQP